MRRIGSVILCVTLCSCGLFSRNYVANEAEKAGRIKMSLAQANLEASADLASMAVVLPTPVRYKEWSQSGGRSDKNTGHIDAGQYLRTAWTVKVGAGAGRDQPLTTPPIIAGDNIFILDAEQTVHALSLQNGEQQWSRPLAGIMSGDKRAIGGGLAFGSGKLIVSSGFGYVAALDPVEGEILWMLETGAPMSGSASIHDGRAYIISSNNDLFALNIENGETIWVDQAIAEPARMLFSSSPAVTDNLLIAPFSSGELIAYLPANGRRLWTDVLSLPGRFSPLSAINDIAARPVLDGNMIYAASQSGVLTAIDSRSGSRMWTLEFPAITPPAIAGQFLFAVNSAAQIVCVNKSDGQIVWSRQLRRFLNAEKQKGRLVWTGPIIALDRLLLLASDGELVALSVQNGEDAGKLQLKQTTFLEPISAEGRIYVLANDGSLLAIE